jgi:DNA-directed RNA polymerase subunit RPC12/RpoP
VCQKWLKSHTQLMTAMMFNAACTSCGSLNKTPSHYEGISIKCVSCGHKFVAADPKENLFKFHCSQCGGRIEAKEKYRGTMAPCPHCEQVVPVGDYTMCTRPLVTPDQPETSILRAKAAAPTSRLKWIIRRIFGK